MAFQSKIKTHLQKLGYTVVKLIRLSDNGYPDLMAMKDGKTIFIESKEAKDTLKELQKYRIDELRKNGFIAFTLQAGKGCIYGKCPKDLEIY